MYTLINKDLTTLGRMGDVTDVRYAKHFRSIQNAKAYAETEYGKKINWRRNGNCWTSGDLNHVMYSIYDMVFED